jgi:hypothetical protein
MTHNNKFAIEIQEGFNIVFEWVTFLDSRDFFLILLKRWITIIYSSARKTRMKAMTAYSSKSAASNKPKLMDRIERSTGSSHFGIFHIESPSKRKYAKNNLLNNCFFWSTGTIFISDNN